MLQIEYRIKQYMKYESATADDPVYVCDHVLFTPAKSVYQNIQNS